MKIRPLIIDEAMRKRVAEILSYAKDHVYIPGETVVPGDDSNYYLITQFGYRAVFSYTRTRQGFYRDISISVDGKNKWPNPIAAYALAQEFGFTGWDGVTITPAPDHWMIAKDVHFNAVRIVQQISL